MRLGYAAYLLFNLLPGVAYADERLDCARQMDTLTMGRCMYQDFSRAEKSLEIFDERVKKNLSHSPEALRFFKLDLDDWGHYMTTACSNTNMGLEDAANGSDSIQRASCKIKLIKARIEVLREMLSASRSVR